MERFCIAGQSGIERWDWKSYRPRGQDCGERGYERGFEEADETITQSNSSDRKILVVAETEVNPTENRERVKEALTSLFHGQVEFRGEPDNYGSARLEGKGNEALARFRMIL